MKRARTTVAQRLAGLIPATVREWVAGLTVNSLSMDSRRRLQEGLTGTALGDSSGTVDGERGWRSMGGKAVLRDLDATSYATMLRVCRWLYCQDMLGAWLIDKPVDMAIGSGDVGYSVEVDKDLAGMPADEVTDRIRDYLDPWWENPLFSLRYSFDGIVTSFLVDGSLTLQIVGHNGTTGTPHLDLIDATQIAWDGVLPLKGRSTVPGQLSLIPAGQSTALVYEIANVDPDTMRYAMAAPDAGSSASPDGAEQARRVFYWRNSRIPNSMRGFSELLPQADWLGAMGDLFWSAVDRARLVNGIVWDVKMFGATAPDIVKRKAEIAANPPTVPGQTYIHNEKEEWKANSGDFGSYESGAMLRSLKNYILGSKSMPEAWYADGGNANRATLSEQGDPTYASLKRYQQRAKMIGRDLLNYCYDQVAERQKDIPKRIDAFGRVVVSLEPTLPPLSQKDSAALAAAVTQLSAGLASAEDSEYVSRKTSREVFLQIMGQLSGVDVEPDEEAGRIEAERSERDARKATADAEKAAQGYASAFANMKPGQTGQSNRGEGDQYGEEGGKAQGGEAEDEGEAAGA